MKHYIVYHNVSKMGSSISNQSGGFFSIFTNKKFAEDLVGNVVWLISGDGAPRQYALEQWFLVDSVEKLDETEAFKFMAVGEKGVVFPDGVPLNSRDWFRLFKKEQENFKFGLKEMSEEFVQAFCSLVASLGYESPAIPDDRPAAPKPTKFPPMGLNGNNGSHPKK